MLKINESLKHHVKINESCYNKWIMKNMDEKNEPFMKRNEPYKECENVKKKTRR